MSLTGNLEDLPLLDIIQIVSFSKKTGYLSIRTEQGEAAIVFADGAIVASHTSATPPLDAAAASLSRERRAPLVRSRIGRALEQLIRLREGQFSFALTDAPPNLVAGRDITQETLEHGLNAQELLLDLARGIDEDRRDSSAALEASFAEPPSGEATGEMASLAPEASAPLAPAAAPEPPPAAPAAEAEAEIRVVLLVDDEDDVRSILSDRFQEKGWDVVEAEDPDAAVKKAGRLGKSGLRFLLVTDLGMPTSGGSSFQGGFEVVKRLWKMGLHPPVLLMTDRLNPALQARARQMGVSSVVFKPGLSKLDARQFEADLRAFAGKLVEDVLPRLARSKEAQPAPAKPKAGPPAAPSLPPASAEELSREYQILQRHLQELRSSPEPTQVAALVMKVAREFFERAVLFLVKNEEVRGLGGFGPAPKGEPLGLLARTVVIPLSEPSAFLDAVAGRKPRSGPLPEGKWSKYLMGKIGRFHSQSAALFPLLAHRETIALLFGDNPETGRDLGRLDALEVFLNQAGVALENAFLQRKVEVAQPKQ